MTQKRISILGSTGSIGTQALEIIARFPGQFKVVGLSARENLKVLAEQAQKFHPSIISVQSEQSARELQKELGSRVKVVFGSEGLNQVSALKDADLVLMALGGSVGLEPLLRAIDGGKDIALANKEPMVMAGKIIMERARKKGVKIIPVDSEHSAIFQLLQGRNRQEISRIILTSSGGPFRTKTRGQMEKATIAEALNHPTWKMGRKISVDSATLMNKALELIEARWFFGLKPEQIEVVIHPQSIVHSLIEMKDGVLFAHLSLPDMKIPIAYALFYPRRPKLNLPRLNLAQLKELKFESADLARFPALKLGFQALKLGGTLPTVMNAANEEAVSAFLFGKIGFNKIVELVEKVMKEHQPKEPRTIQEILTVDSWARQKVRDLINA